MRLSTRFLVCNKAARQCSSMSCKYSMKLHARLQCVPVIHDCVVGDAATLALLSDPALQNSFKILFNFLRSQVCGVGASNNSAESEFAKNYRKRERSDARILIGRRGHSNGGSSIAEDSQPTLKSYCRHLYSKSSDNL